MSEKAPGKLHPLTKTLREMVRVFTEIGFSVAQGPEVELEKYNFDALNVPQDHPARDMQDTFFIKDRDKTVLRTHTSSVQVRYMETHEPPIQIIVPGKAYRNEATDATHEMMFWQVEGLMVGEHISLAHFKGVIHTFFEKFFGKEMDIRFRPGFFPFVEPGFEIDMACFKCDRSGQNCSMCKGTGWVEIIPGGMVHPNVLENVGIDSTKYQGFAFGAGADRLMMMKHEIPDMRLSASQDLRFIHQF